MLSASKYDCVWCKHWIWCFFCVNIYILKLSWASCVVWIKSLVCFFLLKNRRFSLIANDPVIIDKALLRKATSNLGSASLITFTQPQPTRSKVLKIIFSKFSLQIFLLLVFQSTFVLLIINHIGCTAIEWQEQVLKRSVWQRASGGEVHLKNTQDFIIHQSRHKQQQQHQQQQQQQQQQSTTTTINNNKINNNNNAGVEAHLKHSEYHQLGYKTSN